MNIYSNVCVILQIVIVEDYDCNGKMDSVH